MPAWGGSWRNVEVTVGDHRPPLPHEVPVLMHNYGADLAGRWDDASSRNDERLLELLAFAEGRLLFIHPFLDFNGRVTRVFLREIFRRLGLPGISLVPDEPISRRRYIEALGAADRQDYRPLMKIWQDRIGSAHVP